jgi:hypothetical protein
MQTAEVCLEAEKYYTEGEVAKLFKIAKATLRKRRWLGLPPEFVKFGRAVRYPGAGLLRMISRS